MNTRPSQAAISAAMTAQAPAVYDHEPAAIAPLTPMAMIDRALSSGAGIDVIERLMGLQERWEANQGRRAYNEAISEARNELPVIAKGQTATRGERGGSYKYEDMGNIAEAIDPILARHGLSYRFRTETKDGRVFVTCIISHRGGYSEETTLDAPRDDSGGKNAVQAIGSTVTYLQRYTIKAALGLAASKDTDAKVVDTPPSDAMSASDFMALRAEIDKLGADADAAEAYILKRCDAEALDFITKRQCADAMTLIAQRLKLRAEKGAA